MGVSNRLREFGGSVEAFGILRAVGLVLLVGIAVAYGVLAVRGEQTRTQVQRITRIVEGTPGKPGEPGEPGVGITDVIVREIPSDQQAYAVRRAGGILHLFLPAAEQGPPGPQGPAGRSIRGPKGRDGQDGQNGRTIRGPRGRPGKPGEGLSDARLAAAVNVFLRTHTLICQRQGRNLFCHFGGRR